LLDATRKQLPVFWPLPNGLNSENPSAIEANTGRQGSIAPAAAVDTRGQRLKTSQIQPQTAVSALS
jgi:hypothetical protein